MTAALDRLARRDRAVVIAALSVVSLLAWVYLLRMAATMRGAASEKEMHAAMGMTDMAAWSSADLFMLFLMWAVMMAGMMLPSAAPVILLVLGVYNRRGGRAASLSAAMFTAGYLAIWTGFSALATLAQAGLHSAALLSPAMVSSSPILSGVIFLLAGIYQWLPFKNACLSHCRSPLGFITTEWREGIAGAFRMGWRHGLFCLGCCWALMLLLFAAGVMNLLWVAAITAFVLLEKLLPGGRFASRAAGTGLAAWGIYLLVQAF